METGLSLRKRTILRATKAEALNIFEKHSEQWENDPQRMEISYPYKAPYADMMKKVGQEIIQISVGGVPKGINSKKIPHLIWANRVAPAPFVAPKSGHAGPGHHTNTRNIGGAIVQNRKTGTTDRLLRKP